MKIKKDFRPIISESVRLLRSEPCVWVTWPSPLLRLKLIPVPDINDVGAILLCSWKGRFVIGQYIDKYGSQITCTHFVDGWQGPDTVRYDKELALVKHIEEALTLITPRFVSLVLY
jgi:hypothetical protein